MKVAPMIESDNAAAHRKHIDAFPLNGSAALSLAPIPKGFEPSNIEARAVACVYVVPFTNKSALVDGINLVAQKYHASIATDELVTGSEFVPSSEKRPRIWSDVFICKR